MPYHPSDIKILFVLSNKDPANISSVAAAYFVFTESIPDVVIEFASIHGGVCPYNYNLAQDLAQDSNTDIDPRAKAFALDGKCTNNPPFVAAFYEMKHTHIYILPSYLLQHIIIIIYS